MSIANLFSRYKDLDKEEQKSRSREQLFVDVTEDILIFMEDKGVSKSELAEALGKTRGYITQLLSGERHMTLRELSDICYEIGADINIKLEMGNKIALGGASQNTRRK